MNINFRNWNWKHTWKLVAGAGLGAGSAFMAAAVAYANTIPNTSIFAAMSSVSLAEPLIVGALLAGLQGVVQLAEHSFIEPPPGAGLASGELPGPMRAAGATTAVTAVPRMFPDPSIPPPPSSKS